MHLACMSNNDKTVLGGILWKNLLFECFISLTALTALVKSSMYVCLHVPLSKVIVMQSQEMRK